MIVLSLLINIGVLLPVSWGMISGSNWVSTVYGDASPARSILLSVYVSIGIISFILLIWRTPQMVAALLLVQVVYKLTTPFTVGSVSNPVVVSNIVISLVHTITLLLIWRQS
ncbi:MAG: hypothetical protein AAGA53_07170 [Pseudomonadota bacterium]